MSTGKACMSGQNRKNKIARALWLTAGLVCVSLGAVGMVLPVLPTTPFLLAAAACFCKSSPRMYNWLLTNKWFGGYIRNYREGRGLPIRTKITALTVLWVTIAVSIVFFLNRLLPEQLIFPFQLIMVAVAIGVSIHIVRIPTFRKRTSG